MLCGLLSFCICLRLGVLCCFFFQAEDGIRDLVRSRGLGDVYKRQVQGKGRMAAAVIELDALPDSVRPAAEDNHFRAVAGRRFVIRLIAAIEVCLLYTSDAADERSSVELGGRRIIQKKKNTTTYVIVCQPKQSRK